MEESGFSELEGGMVFLISSTKVFWGKGKTLSQEGRYIIDLMASFLKGLPGRVVVSETGPTDAEDSPYFGLPRAWVVMEYLTKKQDFDRDRCSISATGIVARDGLKRKTKDSESEPAERTLEITILERNTYN